MKYLILFLVVISLPLFAQKKKKNMKLDIKIQMTQWMAKISSDPEMREAMIEMILDNTKGNKEEMTRFGNTMMGNPEMNSIITSILLKDINTSTASHQSLSIVGDSAKTIKLSEYELSIKK